MIGQSEYKDLAIWAQLGTTLKAYLALEISVGLIKAVTEPASQLDILLCPLPLSTRPFNSMDPRNHTHYKIFRISEISLLELKK